MEHFDKSLLVFAPEVDYIQREFVLKTDKRPFTPRENIMAKITYKLHTGEQHVVDAENGSTVMEGAIRNAVPGIEAECGGACACATCHLYVDEEWISVVGTAEPMEEDMLDFAYDVRPTSRLSCQIRVSDELDGLVVTIPERQG